MISSIYSENFKKTSTYYIILISLAGFVFGEETSSNYNYDFDLEAAIVNGISPDWMRITYTKSASGLESAPGCPEPYEGRAWVYYGNPLKCYLPGYQWPCPENMTLLPEGNSGRGYCYCACSEYIFDRPGDSHLLNSPKSFCGTKDTNGNNRILAHQKEWGTCHYIFDQGKCADGDWLVFSDKPTLGPNCEKRRCPVEETGTGIYSFFDYRTNLCHKIGDKCEGPDDELYGFSSTYYTSTKSWSPVCDTVATPFSTTYGIQEWDCKETEKFSRILKKCLPRPVARSGGGIG